MPIKEGMKVKVQYKGTLDDGTVFDSSEAHGGEALEFVVGEHKIIPGFESAVIGHEKDDVINIKIEPEDAYGPYNENAVQPVPRSQFPQDIEPKPGMVIGISEVHGDHTHQIPAIIKEVKDDLVFLDLNHPLAGKVLNFEIKIVDFE
ncbi:MAG: FKBP-type peptidyl-prolyl cis-trans isomerase [Promethearchaeota archaeon]